MQVCVRNAVLRHALHAGVAAAVGNVAAHVLPEIDQLQGGADLVTLGQRCSVVDAIQVQQQASDRIGRQPAVVVQFGIGLVAARSGGIAHILLERVEQICQQWGRQVETGDHGCERAKNIWPA